MPGGPLGSFRDAAVRSGLLTEPSFEALIAKSPKAVHGDAAAFADWLVAGNHLTRFQADKLLAGTWQGLSLGKFKVLAPIGRGGMGVVYLAEADGRQVALKILMPKTAREEPQRLARFIREIQLGLSIPPHAHVAPTISGGEINGVNYLAMPFVPGVTLKKRVAERGPIAGDEASGLFAGLADALVHVHTAGIVHRDIKPGNVVLTPGGRATLLDFGFAIKPGEPLPDDPRIVGGKGYAIGTMDYIPPEQIRDASTVTFASDLYSFGCTLFFALTGTPPFPGGDAQQKLKWHRTSDVPDVRAINTAVSMELAEIVSSLLAKEPNDRPSAIVTRDRLRAIAGPIVLTINPIGFDRTVEELTHRKTSISDVFEPILANDVTEGVQKRNRELPDWFWWMIGGLGVLVLAFIIVAIALIATKRPK